MSQGFIWHPRFGGIAGSGGICWGSGDCAPSRFQGQSLWSGGLGQSPSEDEIYENFLLHGNYFLHFLRGIVEIQHLDFMFIVPVRDATGVRILAHSNNSKAYY